MSLTVSDSRYVLEVLSDSSSLQEILWNFCRLKDEKERLTLRDNPHFYAELPTSPEAYGDSVQIDPATDFRSASMFYVLTDKPKLAYIMTNRPDLQFFSNFWCPKDAFIFKGLGVLFFPRVSDILPDICGRLRGERVGKTSLRDTHCGFCERIPVSIVPSISRNRRELLPIITAGCPWAGLEFSIGCLPVLLPIHGSDDTCVRVCTGRAPAPDGPVRCDNIIPA